MSLILMSLTVLCVVGISLGQLLFKKAALALSGQVHWTAWIFNGWLIVALVLYGFTTLLWVWILRSAPLHLAYPFMGMAFVLVPLLGWLALGEPLHWQTMAGGGLILIGVTLAAQGGQ
ncbi:EamA family transporter [Comamonas sp. w2-DMI]|uniref:EamA family transporter n=1 Tax=Comamonas sp. w2-DMI TaxID=3126391 RepID=UPI0032E4FE6A